MSRLVPIAAALLLAFAIAACDRDEDGPPPGMDGEKLDVMTSLGIFADFVREVGGDRAEVASLLPPGADPHTFEPSPSDTRRITEADIIFVNDDDPGVEGSILDLIQTNKREDTKVIAFMANVVSPRAEELGDSKITAAEAGDNPHLWLDPFLARSYVDLVADTFIIEDGINADFYNDNREAYRQRLTQLDNDFAALVDQIPAENRTLVTSHDAFPHLARRYGLQVAGFIAPSPGQDPSPRDIADLTKAIRDQGVPAVFTEPQIGAGSRLLDQVAADTGVQVCTLYSGALDDSVPTYIQMMRFNANELLRCLGDGDG